MSSKKIWIIENIPNKIYHDDTNHDNHDTYTVQNEKNITMT